MSVLDVAQNIARELGLNKPGSLVGSTDETNVRMLALIKRAGVMLSKKHDWSVLTSETTITTSDGTAYYALASDFDRFINQTHWDRTNDVILRGPINPQRWQEIKSGVLQTAPIKKGFRVKALAGVKKIYIDPTPSATETLAYEYITNKWLLNSDASSELADIATDTDYSKFDEYLLELEVKWRLLESLGLNYLEARDEADVEIRRAIGRDGASPKLNMGESASVILLANTQETGFGD